jgi:hypothetical protein
MNPATTSAWGSAGPGGGGGFTFGGPAIIVANPGTPGTGGGGAGGVFTIPASPSPSNGAAGGSGVVILAIPTPNYPGMSAPGAAVSTPPAAPGLTVLTYTTPSPGTPATFTLTA